MCVHDFRQMHIFPGLRIARHKEGTGTREKIVPVLEAGRNILEEKHSPEETLLHLATPSGNQS